MTHQPFNSDKKSLREFGIVTGIIVVLLFGLFLPWLLEHSYPLWPWIILIIMGSLALILPTALGPIYKIWMRFGLVMGWINTRIILGLVFYVLFTPIAMVLKILGKDPMRRKLEQSIHSYRITSKQSSRENMENPF